MLWICHATHTCWAPLHLTNADRHGQNAWVLFIPFHYVYPIFFTEVFHASLKPQHSGAHAKRGQHDKNLKWGFETGPCVSHHRWKIDPLCFPTCDWWPGTPWLHAGQRCPQDSYGQSTPPTRARGKQHKGSHQKITQIASIPENIGRAFFGRFGCYVFAPVFSCHLADFYCFSSVFAQQTIRMQNTRKKCRVSFFLSIVHFFAGR